MNDIVRGLDEQAFCGPFQDVFVVARFSVPMHNVHCKIFIIFQTKSYFWTIPEAIAKNFPTEGTISALFDANPPLATHQKNGFLRVLLLYG